MVPIPELPKLLVAGVGPLPPENPERLSAPGLRIWGIARELAREGHSVRLATVHFSGAPLTRLYLHDLHPGDRASELPPGHAIDLHGSDLGKVLEAQALEFEARAAVASTDLINRELGRLEIPLPLWCDFFGDPMAERQMIAALHQSDDGIADQWKTLTPALRRADRLSGCSRYQAGAIHGELAAVGRLNRHTASERLVHILRPWIDPIQPTGEDKPRVRGVSAPEDAVIALQTGGFNTWLDIETLFAALTQAMRAHPRLHFAATGGAIPGHDERTFGRFEQMVKSSPLRGRFHLLGWIELGQTPRVIAECDFGLNVDRPCPEGWLGTRNRLMDWIMGGLPVVSTRGTELVEDLADRDLIEIAAQGDANAVAGAITNLLLDPGRAKQRARTARSHLQDHYSARRSLEPLLEWARRPKPASDLQAWRDGRGRPNALWLDAGSEALRAAEMDRNLAELESLKAEHQTLKGSRCVRTAMWIRNRFGRGSS